jgi:hypothetical protein
VEKTLFRQFIMEHHIIVLGIIINVKNHLNVVHVEEPMKEEAWLQRLGHRYNQ